MPKQFMSLLDGHSTFQRVMRLVSDRRVFDAPIVITHHDYRFTAQEQLRQVDVEAEIVLEPVRRNSAAAVAVAAELALRRHRNAVAGVFAADHLVQNAQGFIDVCASAAQAARDGRIVTMGIPATSPATGYGYIRPGVALDGHPTARRVEAFIEKPDPLRAARFVLEGYLWNSGNFIFDAVTMRDEMERHAPDVLRSARAALEEAARDLDFLVLERERFTGAPSIAIDVAVMEKTDRAAVVPGGFGWSDVGSWGAVWDVSPKDADGNAISGRGYVLEGRNNLVRSDDAVVAVVGLSDVAVISTRDAVLVMAREDGDKVRTVVETIRKNGESEAGVHRELHRPWGKYLSIDIGQRHQVKRITVKPGGKLSLQKHFHRAEHWIVVRGTAEVTRNGEVLIVHENESVYLPIGCLHRLGNPGKIPLELIEVQVGSYLGEDDIVRLEDVYRRS